jgi:iron-sulfur cluster assembly protein
MLKVTAAAAAAILDAANRSGAEDAALRVAAKLGEDGVIRFGVGFDDEREQDHVVESYGVRVLIAPPSQELLAGVTLDFGEVNPGELGFVFVRDETGLAAEPGPGGAAT